jgi:hypothetical protein
MYKFSFEGPGPWRSTRISEKWQVVNWGGGASGSYEIFNAGGAHLVLQHNGPNGPTFKLNYYFAGVSASTTGFFRLKPPKGTSKGVQLSSEGFPSKGVVLMSESFLRDDLSIHDFVGACAIQDVSLNLWVQNLGLTLFLVGVPWYAAPSELLRGNILPDWALGAYGWLRHEGRNNTLLSDAFVSQAKAAVLISGMSPRTLATGLGASFSIGKMSLGPVPLGGVVRDAALEAAHAASSR